MTMAFEKGMQLAEEGQFADAIACFRKAIAEGLETPEVFECLAQCEMMLDTLSSSQRAVVAAQEALQRLGAEEAPGRLSWVDATLTLARALRCNFDLPAAVDAYHAAVRLGASAPAELQSAEEELLEHRRRLKRLPSMEGWHRRFQRQIDRAKRLRRPEWSAEKWRSNNLAAMDLGWIEEADMLITMLLCLNVFWMGFELQFSGSKTGVDLGVFQETLIPLEWWSTFQGIFAAGDICFTVIFSIDVIVRIVVKFWRSCMNYIDVIVTLASLLEMVISNWTAVNPAPR
eukprot:g11578.t1